MSWNKKKYNEQLSGIISAANLPDNYAIEDPRGFLRDFRASFLHKARLGHNLSIEDVSTQIGVPVSDLKRIERGEINERDLMALRSLAGLYEIDYSNLLFLYKLVKRPTPQRSLKMAACHDQKMDEETMKEVLEFVKSLEESIE